MVFLLFFQSQGFNTACHSRLNGIIFGPYYFTYAVDFVQSHLQRKKQYVIKESEERINLILIKIHKRLVSPCCCQVDINLLIFHLCYKVSCGMMPGVNMSEG